MSGAHYFLSIVDDFSRTTWVYLMRNKTEVDHLLVSFIAMVHKQFDSHVKQIRSDNGTEFTAHKFQQFCQEKGIVQQFSCVSTPQQNGVVERKHRQLLEVARALRFQ